jgi:hypothetical protein
MDAGKGHALRQEAEGLSRSFRNRAAQVSRISDQNAMALGIVVQYPNFS